MGLFVGVVALAFVSSFSFITLPNSHKEEDDNQGIPITTNLHYAKKYQNMQLTKERMSLANISTGGATEANKMLTSDLQQLLMYKKSNEGQHGEHGGGV